MSKRGAPRPVAPVRTARHLGATVALAIASLASPASPARAADLERGAALYENHCGECHDRNVHRRERRAVDSVEELRVWVRAWSAHQGLRWGEEEIDDVSAWLAAALYRFDG